MEMELKQKREEMNIPLDFPHFRVPGFEHEMGELRELFWIHYKRSGALIPLWDEWLPVPTLWPATKYENRMNKMREEWRAALLGRGMDEEGYVFTHQHASIAHQHGWPFPYWRETEPGTWGWHFSLPDDVPHGMYETTAKTQVGWTIKGIEDNGIENLTWNLETAEAESFVDTPCMEVNAEQSPFIQLRWGAKGLGNAFPYLQWTTEDEPGFSNDKMMYLKPVDTDSVVYTMIPVYRHPRWKGKITRLRIGFGNMNAGVKIRIQALFTQYDTRHTVNNPNFICGSIHYFNWTRDINFLRENIQRMRLAMRYAMTEFGGEREKCIVAPFVGHCGRPGFTRKEDGSKEFHYGRAIGHNYWDILPMGHKDIYATIYYYNSLLKLADLEKEIENHPEWSVPGGPLRIPYERLYLHAQEVKEFSTKLFWNEKNKRFVPGIDIDGMSYDYGHVFLNLEAIYYDFATSEQAKEILSWISGERIIEDDTSKGTDIYHWRFGPRSTTKRNLDHYFWMWVPETFKWGDQVQDGGSVLGFSYFDLISRLRYYGPDNCWARLKEIIAWYTEVQESGGPREYYKDGSRGTMQGNGVAGGLGIDFEFFESILVPQIMILGFLGLEARVDGLCIDPKLPNEWDSLSISNIHYHDAVLNMEVRGNEIIIRAERGKVEDIRFHLPLKSRWTLRRE